MMTKRAFGCFAVLAFVLSFTGPGLAMDDPGWPREVTVRNHRLVVHQPQIDAWPDYAKIEARMVVEIIPPDEKKPILGAIWLTGDTRADLATRLVKLDNVRISKTNFPSLDQAASDKLTRLLSELLPKTWPDVSLDRILANMKRTKESDRSFVGSDEPPVIFTSTRPAILVELDGDPVLYPIDGTDLAFAVNTNWDLFFHSKEKAYYLLNGDTWLTTRDLSAGPWTAVTQLPADFRKIPEDDDWKTVRQSLTIKKQTKTGLPTVFVSMKPAELVVIQGRPQLTRVQGTEISIVSNTESDLFFYQGDNSYYYLVSGRWFSSAGLEGPWTAVGKDLPGEFAKIPAAGPRGRVLAAVPGTAEAEEAIIHSEIPQRATVKRGQAKLEVPYNGEPTFEPIEGTSMKYAVNTPNDVIQVDGKYYACVDGVWFVSDSAAGPWKVADSIPDQIYTIPPSSPVYRTSYVQVYGSNEDEVEFGYTAGYLGSYPCNGALVYGTGYYYRPYLWPGPRPIFWPRPYSYGCAAWYNPVTGNFGRAGVVYGPYGGIGRGAVYNPSSGAYARGVVAWGPHGGVAAGIAYSPATGFHAGVHYFNPYTRWGSAAAIGGAAGAAGLLGAADRQRAARDAGKALTGRDRTAPTGGAERAQAARDRMARPDGSKPPVTDRVAAARPTAGVAGKGSGDLYVGKDGNIYRKTGDNKWSEYTSNKDWKPVTTARETDRSTDSTRQGEARQRAQQERAREARTEQQQLKERIDDEQRTRRQLEEQSRLREQASQEQRARDQQGRQQRLDQQRVADTQTRSQLNQEQIHRDLQRDAQTRSRGNQMASSFQSYQRSGGAAAYRSGGLSGGGARTGGGRRR